MRDLPHASRSTTHFWMAHLFGTRLWALCRKEARQILRDPSSILMGFIMPIVLLVFFGYAVNLDSSRLHLGLVLDDQGSAALDFAQALSASPSFEVQPLASTTQWQQALRTGHVRGVVLVPKGFSERWSQGARSAQAPSLQIITDGSEPNTAQFVATDVTGIYSQWLQAQQVNRAISTTLAAQRQATAPPVVEIRTWYNPSAVSRNYLIPGSISVVMTIIGALLTSLVVAREWERGTMEALLATPVTRMELLLSKILPYYVLGMVAMGMCVAFATLVMQVPLRGPLWALILMSSLFLFSALGQGLFISTVMRNQFNAAQAALTAAFLPALMLSGFIYEISNMPLALRVITHLVPARYFASSLQTIFQVGVDAVILGFNAVCMLLIGSLWMILTASKTRRRLD